LFFVCNWLLWSSILRWSSAASSNHFFTTFWLAT
jgi:hypothetical protein